MSTFEKQVKSLSREELERALLDAHHSIKLNISANEMIANQESKSEIAKATYNTMAEQGKANLNSLNVAVGTEYINNHIG